MATKRIRHEVLPKDLAPKQGGTYTLCNQDSPLYQAEITHFNGGCWATVRVTNPLHNTGVYKVGDTFDIKVAAYQFQTESDDTQ